MSTLSLKHSSCSIYFLCCITGIMLCDDYQVTEPYPLSTVLPLFNNVLNGGSMPLMWCSGLITPIFMSGVRNGPTNYRTICVSNCLGKLFCSILNQRLMEHVNSLNILHNSQIGLLPNNQTADHVLTQRTLIDKYAHCHQEKVYA